MPGPLSLGSPAIGSKRLSGWRAGPSADAVRLRQMAWVAETANATAPRAVSTMRNLVRVFQRKILAKPKPTILPGMLARD